MPPESLPASAFVKRARSVKASSRSKVSVARFADDAAQIGVQMQIFEHGQVFVEAEALRHVADGLMQRDAVLDGVVAADRERACGRRRAAPPSIASAWSCRRRPARPRRSLARPNREAISIERGRRHSARSAWLASQRWRCVRLSWRSARNRGSFGAGFKSMVTGMPWRSSSARAFTTTRRR